MASARAEISQTILQGDEPADVAMNVLHFNSGTDYAALANWLLLGFTGQIVQPDPNFDVYIKRKIEIKVYDIADPKPRPERAFVSHTPPTWGQDALGPRLLACCLSFYASRNLPRIRGRIYVGPFLGVDTAHEEIPGDRLASVMALGQYLHKGVSGWQHITRSNTEANEVGGGGEALAEQKVTNYWADSNWDVMHSRELRTATRVLYP